MAGALQDMHSKLVAATAKPPAKEYDDEGLEEAVNSLVNYLVLAAQNAIVNANKNPRFAERGLQSTNFFRFDPPVRDAGRPLQNVRWHGFLMVWLLTGTKEAGIQHWVDRGVTPVLQQVKERLGPFGVACKWLGMDSGFVCEVRWGADPNTEIQAVVSF